MVQLITSIPHQVHVEEHILQFVRSCILFALTGVRAKWNKSIFSNLKSSEGIITTSF